MVLSLVWMVVFVVSVVSAWMVDAGCGLNW